MAGAEQPGPDEPDPLLGPHQRHLRELGDVVLQRRLQVILAGNKLVLEKVPSKGL